MPAVWTGSVNFGLVSVPVEAAPAVREQRLRFRLLHEVDSTPIRHERVREDDGEPVPWEEIVKGYEVSPGNYVVLHDEDFADAAVEQDHVLEIREFVDVHAVDARYFERSYFLLPGAGGARRYALLREALRETQLGGIGTMVINRRQHLMQVRADGNALVLLQMRFADELVPERAHDLPAGADLRDDELQMAVQIVRGMQGPFDPSKYVDEYEQNLRRIIDARSFGARVQFPEPARAEREPRVLDLMTRLRRSLEEREARGEAHEAGLEGPQRHRA